MTMLMAETRFVWHELITPDPDAAVAFYAALLGWTSDTQDMAFGPYRMWSVGDCPFGGIMPGADAGGAHWRGTVQVTDTDAAVARAQAAGASLLHPCIDMPEVGRIALLRDPQGAQFGVITPVNRMPAPTRPMGICWNDLISDDTVAHAAFYHAVLGWDAHRNPEMPEGDVWVLKEGEAMVASLVAKPCPQSASAWIPYTFTPDIATALARVPALGGQTLMGLTAIPYGQIAVCRDPQGAPFGLFQPAFGGPECGGEG